jgi:hypothetical protein
VRGEVQPALAVDREVPRREGELGHDLDRPGGEERGHALEEPVPLVVRRGHGAGLEEERGQDDEEGATGAHGAKW